MGARQGQSVFPLSVDRVYDEEVVFLATLAAVAGAKTSLETWERMTTVMRPWKRGSVNPLKMVATINEMTRESDEVCCTPPRAQRKH